MRTLIIIRGNSGSGKTSTAKKLRSALQHTNPGRKVAIVSQDQIRRDILAESHSQLDPDDVDLIESVSLFALSRGYDVILEGILMCSKYHDMLSQLINQFDRGLVYYLDIPLAQTLLRHQTKSNAHEFGEDQMREWYLERDILGFETEIIIDHSKSQEEIISIIQKDNDKRVL